MMKPFLLAFVFFALSFAAASGFPPGSSNSTPVRHCVFASPCIDDSLQGDIYIAS
jgi:hypothetical protein